MTKRIASVLIIAVAIALVAFVLIVEPAHAGCSSDYDCGMGAKCVKGSFQSSGRCIQVERSYGVPDYTRSPRPDSVGPNMTPPRGWQACPIGYFWNYDLQICLRN